MPKRLPKFEGHDVGGARLKINGLGEDLADALSLGTRVHLVIEAEIYDVAHVRESKGDTYLRVHKAAIIRTGVMDTQEAMALLDAEAERRASQADDEAGRAVLPFSGTGRRNRDGEVE